MFGLEQLFTLVFVLFALSTFAVLLILRYNRKRIEHKGELVQKEVEKEKAVQQTAFVTQEAERKRIGEDLHDDIGPQLAFLKMQLSLLKKKSASIDTETYNELAAQLNNTIKQVRKVSHDLVPNVLYEFGLPTAIRSISRQLNKMPNLSSEAIISEDLPEMDKKKELAIYRIVQESVNNAIKHADARSIDIHITVEKNQVIAKVIDDGVGVAEDKKDLEGVGMKSMHERARAFEGVLDLKSENGQGTVVLLELPL